MTRSLEEFEGGLSRSSVETPFPPLNLHLTITPEFINSIETILQRDYSVPHQQKLLCSTQNTKTLTPHEAPINTEKSKAWNVQISKITIGGWIHTWVYPDDLKAKFYFARKKLMWEILDYVNTETQVSRLKRKIELKWSDILSFRATFHPNGDTLQIELGKRPTFFMETKTQVGKHTQWTEMDQDFTPDHSASRHRRHTLHFFPGDLQKTLEKLVLADSFWSKLAQVNFPTLPQSLYFDIGYGNSNNNVSSNLCPHGNNEAARSFSISNSHSHHHYPQGFGHLPVENFNTITQFGMQMNSFGQEDNHQIETMSQLPMMQVNHPSSDLINMGSDFNYLMIQDEGQTTNTGELGGSEAYAQETQTNSMMFQDTNDHQIETMSQLPMMQVNHPSSDLINMGSHFNYLMIQDEGQTTNTGELGGSEAYAQETQTNSMMFQDTNDHTLYPIGPYLLGIINQEGAI